MNELDCSPFLKLDKRFDGARPGFEPGTSRTRSENHTPRPTGRTTAEAVHSSKSLLRTLGNKQLTGEDCARRNCSLLYVQLKLIRLS
jgi:hypothetical protein